MMTKKMLFLSPMEAPSPLDSRVGSVVGTVSGSEELMRRRIRPIMAPSR